MCLGVRVLGGHRASAASASPPAGQHRQELPNVSICHLISHWDIPVHGVAILPAIPVLGDIARIFEVTHNLPECHDPFLDLRVDPLLAPRLDPFLDPLVHNIRFDAALFPIDPLERFGIF